MCNLQMEVALDATSGDFSSLNHFFYTLYCLLFALSSISCDSPQLHKAYEENKSEKVTSTSNFQFKSLNITFEYKWLESLQGNINRPNSIIVYLFNSKGELTDLPLDVSINFFATMPSMGHPLDRPGDFNRIARGIYLNTGIIFNMPGEWEMEIYLDKNGSTYDKVTWLNTF